LAPVSFLESNFEPNGHLVPLCVVKYVSFCTARLDCVKVEKIVFV
jgi:hypothetical protein